MKQPEYIYLFARFERFWHWSQAALVITLGATGFEVHGFYELFGFEKAVEIHSIAAWLLIGLWIFAIFWHFTTGEWKQYIPTTDKLFAMMGFYLTGIFTNAEHPFHPTKNRKHNPLQRLAYLSVWVIINPLIWCSGWLLLFYGEWKIWGLSYITFGDITFVHTAAAYMMLLFLVVHLYFATTGHTPFSQIKAMITGWERIDD